MSLSLEQEVNQMQDQNIDQDSHAIKQHETENNNNKGLSNQIGKLGFIAQKDAAIQDQSLNIQIPNACDIVNDS